MSQSPTQEQRDAHSTGRVCAEGLPQLLWSSRATPAPGINRARISRISTDWTCLPWPKAATRLGCCKSQTVLWVLEPDPVEGPTPDELAQLLQSSPGSTHTLVLMPEASGHDCAQWLDAGADRCMPASSAQTLRGAMVYAMLRRLHGMTASVSVLGPLHFDHVSQTLFHGEQRIWLTCRETQVIDLLFRSSMQRVKAQEVLETLTHGEGGTGHRGLVALYVHRVNRKIKPLGVQIEAIRGFGYSLRLLMPDPRQIPTTRSPSYGLNQWLRVAHAAMPGKVALQP